MLRSTKRQFVVTAISGAVALLIAHCGASSIADDTAADEPTINVIAPRKGDTCTVTQTMGEAVIAIRSDFGIGTARITRAGDALWPEKIVLQLHLKGLEGFHAENDRLRLHGALGLDGIESYERDDAGAWREVEVKPEHGMPIRRSDERIEVELPKVLLHPDAKTVSIQWIDFYR